MYTVYTVKENLNWKKKENDLKNSLHKLFFLDILFYMHRAETAVLSM